MLALFEANNWQIEVEVEGNLVGSVTDTVS